MSNASRIQQGQGIENVVVSSIAGTDYLAGVEEEGKREVEPVSPLAEPQQLGDPICQRPAVLLSDKVVTGEKTWERLLLRQQRLHPGNDHGGIVSPYIHPNDAHAPEPAPLSTGLERSDLL